jgi:hypothetical protein
MRQLIQVEGIAYVEDLATALITAEFARGKGESGWVISLDDILFKADKRDRVFRDFQQVRPPNSGAQQIVGGQPAKPEGMPEHVWQKILADRERAKQERDGAQQKRFPADKTAETVANYPISGECANDILDEVPGSTYDQVRKALIAASGQFRVAAYNKRAGKADILDWVKHEVRWAVAYAAHGKPEQHAGGAPADLPLSDWERLVSGGSSLLSAHSAIVTQSFLDRLKAEYPHAWREQETDHPLRIAFKELTGAIAVEQYNTDSQRMVEAGLIEWARMAHERATAEHPIEEIAS